MRIKGTPKERSPRSNGRSGLLAVLLPTALLFSFCAAARGDAVSADVEAAVLAENWTKVAECLHSVSPDTNPAVPRMVLGHACLALNRNNDSLALLASGLNDGDRESWKTWVEDFAARHPRSSIAWYFKGDALARLKTWNSAIACFDKAIQLDPQCYLALNARGVVAHAVGNTLMARLYFVKAIKAKADFADAYASRGTLGVYLSLAAGDEESGPGRAFGAAKKHSRDRAPLLPMVGLGCLYCGRQQFREAKECFDGVPDNSALSLLARRNAFAVEIQRGTQTLAKTSDAGMTTERRQFEQLLRFQNAKYRSEDEFWRDMIELAYRELERLRELYRQRCTGENANSDFCKELARRIKELEDAIRDITQKPDKAQARSLSGMQVSPIGTGEVGTMVNFEHASKLLRSVTSGIARTLAAIEQQKPLAPARVGGVDSDPRKLRHDRGEWDVHSIYGLLYPVPAGSSRQRAAQPTASPD